MFRHVTPRLVATVIATLFLVQLIGVAGSVSSPQLRLSPSAACVSDAQCSAYFGSGYTCDHSSGYCVYYGGGGYSSCSSDTQCQAAFGPGYTCDHYSGYCVFYGGGGGSYGCSTNAQCQAAYGPGYSCDTWSGSCVYTGGYGGCQEGAINVIDNCPNGSWKTRQVCQNGAWKQETQACPQCTDGDRKIIDYCADGTTWKTREVCQNGAWKQESQACPQCSAGQTKDLEYCADGVTWKTQKTCENGAWVQQNNPKPCPQCWPEGKIEILENCPDGKTWKNRQVCENGAWTREANDEPCPQCWPEGKTVDSPDDCFLGGPMWTDVCTYGEWDRTYHNCILPCLIATATYGSELAPEVQFLRNFRDQSIVQTRAGRQFMMAFNLWYYSFSPTVAQFIGTHEGARTLSRGILYPLMGILHLSALTFSVLASQPELAALASGVVASSLIGVVYVALPMAGVFWIARRRIDGRTQRTVTKCVAMLIVLLLDGFVISELLGFDLVLTFVSAGIALSFLTAGGILPAFKIVETAK